MVKTLHYLFQTARREFGLVGAIKFVCFVLLPTLWAFIAKFLELKLPVPSTFTLGILTILFFSIGLLFVIGKRAQSLEEPKFDLDLHFPKPVKGENPACLASAESGPIEVKS